MENLETLGDRLNWALDKKGMSQSELARRIGVKPQSIQAIVSGKAKTSGRIAKIARVLGLNAHWLADNEGKPWASQERPRVKAVGYIGAGDQVFPIDDHMRGAGLTEVPCPPDLDPHSVVAAIVRGNSMFPLEDGWLVFWGPRAGPPEAVGHTCAVQVADDGPLLIKGVRQAPKRGRYNLVSSNAPMLENVKVEWTSRILSVLPPDR